MSWAPSSMTAVLLLAFIVQAGLADNLLGSAVTGDDQNFSLNYSFESCRLVYNYTNTTVWDVDRYQYLFLTDPIYHEQNVISGLSLTAECLNASYTDSFLIDVLNRTNLSAVETVSKLAVSHALASWPKFPQQFKNLVTLNLTGNRLSGKIGNLSLFIDSFPDGQPRRLKSLILNYNLLSGLNERLCELDSLEFLELNNNQFETFDMADLVCDNLSLNHRSILSSLKVLDLSFNNIRQLDSFDIILMAMPQLRVANFNQNNLTKMDYRSRAISPRLVSYLDFLKRSMTNSTLNDSSSYFETGSAFTASYNCNPFRMRLRSNKMTRFAINMKGLIEFVFENQTLLNKDSFISRLLCIDVSVNRISCDSSLENDLLTILNRFLGLNLRYLAPSDLPDDFGSDTAILTNSTGLTTSTRSNKIPVQGGTMVGKFRLAYFSFLKSSLACLTPDTGVSMFFAEMLNNTFEYNLSTLYDNTPTPMPTLPPSPETTMVSSATSPSMTVRSSNSTSQTTLAPSSPTASSHASVTTLTSGVFSLSTSSISKATSSSAVTTHATAATTTKAPVTSTNKTTAAGTTTKPNSAVRFGGSLGHWTIIALAFMGFRLLENSKFFSW